MRDEESYELMRTSRYPHSPNTIKVVRRNDDPGARNLVSKMQEVIRIYNTYKALFPVASTFVVAAVYHGSTALPEAIRTISLALQRLQLRYIIEQYNEVERSCQLVATRTI